MTLSEAAARIASAAINGNLFAGAATIPDMTARVGELRGAIGEQEAIAAEAAGEADRCREALAKAEAVRQRQADKLASLRQAKADGETRIEAKRADERRDKLAAEQNKREAERNRLRAERDNAEREARQ